MTSLGVGVGALLVVVLTWAMPALAQASTGGVGQDGPDLEPATFANPASELRSKFFWEWPGGAVQNDQLTADVQEMSQAGFGGGMIFPVLYGLPLFGPLADQLPPETTEWAEPAFAESVRVAAEAARQHDFTLDMFIGPQWPLASPAVAGENSDLAAQELAFADIPVEGPATFDDAVPIPTGGDQHLVAATAARVVADPGPEGNIVLDPQSAVDLTSFVDQDDDLQWDVPAGDWLIFGFWQRETGQRPNFWPEPYSVVDHLSREPVEATMDYFEENVLDPMGKDLRRDVLEQTNTDSYEMEAQLIWTHDFLEEFEDRRGYDLRPYLPVLFVPGQHNLGSYYGYCTDQRTDCTPPPATHDFPGDAGDRVRRDYYETFTELFTEEHLGALRERSSDLGATFGAEPFGLTADVIAGSKAVDVPMTEDHWNRSVDFMKMVSSGAHLSGAEKASIEVGTAFGRDYMMTLREIKRRADKAFAAGISELKLAGYPTPVAPFSQWPGWHPFSTEFLPVGFDTGWTTEMPVWHHMKPLADYFGRAQAALQSGKPVSDIAVYRNWYGYAGDPFTAADPPEMPLTEELSSVGYGFDFVNPDTLEQPRTDVRGDRLEPRRGDTAYRALVVDLDEARGMDVTDGAMEAAVAERLVEFARSGLPIVFVGDFPSRGASFADPEAEDAAVSDAVDRLRRNVRVEVAPDAAAVPAALAKLGISSDLEFDAPQDVYSAHRRAGDLDYWFLWNRGDDPASFTGSFRSPAGATPQRWDLWAGEVEEVGRYREIGGRIEMPIELDALETTLIVLKPGSKPHVTETDADEVIVGDGGLVLRSTRGGPHTATLSDGSEETLELPVLPAPVVLNGWSLHVDGSVPSGTEQHDLQLPVLRDWREIPELAGTSGTGTYRSTVDLPADWASEGRGAYLELGEVHGGVQVSVNGELAYPASVPSSRIDVGPLLQPGENEIEVELTTTLKNRLVALSETVPEYARFQSRPETQPYGLIGPVRLVPYGERRIGETERPETEPQPPDTGPQPPQTGPQGKADLRLKARPKVRRVAHGKRQTHFRVLATNVGDGPSGTVRLCARGPSRRVKIVGKRCVVREIPAGAQRERSVRVAIRPAARGKTTRIRLSARGAGIEKRQTTVRLKAKG